MKRIKMLILFVLVFAFMPIFSACSSQKVLGTPEELSLNESTYTVSWKAVENADYYGVEINGKIHQTTKTTFSLAEYVEQSGVYQIRVVAFSKKGDIKDSAFTKYVTINKKSAFATPNLTYDAGSGTLSWEAVEGAYHYNLNINGVDFLTTKTNFNLFEDSELDSHLIKGSLNKFYVYCPATSANLSSSFSNEIDVYIANNQSSSTNS